MDHYFSTQVWNPSALSSENLLILCVITAVLLALFPCLLRLYNRYMETLRFQHQVDRLALGQQDANVLQAIINRYALNEPVQILLSLPLFDELAQKEIVRVLQDSYPSKAKLRYIDSIYDIRQKVYFDQLIADVY